MRIHEIPVEVTKIEKTEEGYLVEATVPPEMERYLESVEIKGLSVSWKLENKENK